MASLRTAVRRVPAWSIDDDPFWSVVRRRHPGADVVLVPDTPTSPPPAPLSAEQARTTALLVGRTWVALAPSVRRAAGLPDDAPPPSPAVAWRAGAGAGHALVLTKGLPGIGLHAGRVLLHDIGTALLEAGWSAAPHRGPQGESALRACGPRVDVEAIAGPGATVVRIASRMVTVDADVRDRVHEEVTSWV